MKNELTSQPVNIKQMPQESDNNMYACLLKQQGSYVIRIDDIDWHDYGGFMVPAYLPHLCPGITEEMAREVVRVSGRPFARWPSRYGMKAASQWWYILRKGTWSLEQCSSNTRSKIRRGYKRLISRPISPAEVLASGYEVCAKAVTRYGSKEFLPSRMVFEKKIGAASIVPGVLEFFGVFSGTQLVGYSENYIQDDAVFWESIWYDPAFLSDYSSYVLTAEMLTHYLNERHFKYALDGCRSIYHKSEVQEYFINKFGFTKEFAVLNVHYSSRFAIAVKSAYPFRKAVWSLENKWQNSTLDKVSGVLRQENIRRACDSQRAVLTLEPKAVVPSGPGQLHIRELIAPDAGRVAEMHIKGIRTGFISTLGIKFLTAVYQSIATSKNGFGIVALRDDKIIGFAAFSADTSALYMDIFLKKGFRFATLLAGRLFSYRQIRNIAETILYPVRTKKESLQVQGELLSTVVVEEERGKGISQAILREGFEICRKKQIEKIKILVAADNKPANRLYEKCGFTLLCQIYNHGIKSNIYTGLTDFFQKV